MALMKVKSGIKQGCTGSPQLFLMIANIIIKEIQKTGNVDGYEAQRWHRSGNWQLAGQARPEDQCGEM